MADDEDTYTEEPLDQVGGGWKQYVASGALSSNGSPGAGELPLGAVSRSNRPGPTSYPVEREGRSAFVKLLPFGGVGGRTLQLRAGGDRGR